MHLAERRGGERLGLETLEHLLRRRAELARHLRADDVVRHRRHRRLHGRQHLERFGRQEIAAHAQHLRQLHEGALELGRALDDADRVPHVRSEKIAVGALLRLEWPLQRLPDVAASEGRRERPDFEHAPGATGRQRARRPRPRARARARRAGRARRLPVMSWMRGRRRLGLPLACAAERLVAPLARRCHRFTQPLAGGHRGDVPLTWRDALPSRGHGVEDPQRYGDGCGTLACPAQIHNPPPPFRSVQRRNAMWRSARDRSSVGEPHFDTAVTGVRRRPGTVIERLELAEAGCCKALRRYALRR